MKIGTNHFVFGKHKGLKHVRLNVIIDDCTRKKMGKMGQNKSMGLLPMQTCAFYPI